MGRDMITLWIYDGCIAGGVLGHVQLDILGLTIWEVI